MRSKILVVMAVLLVCSVAAKDACHGDNLAVYNLTLQTNWTEKLFPKHFPEWRPPAQWSGLVGRSHAPSYQLFRVGRTASEGLKLFAETGRSHLLELESDAGVLDQFSGSPVPSGQGTSSTRFFVDSAHSRVSAVVRLVPSPDWFVGLDSVELCSQGYWLDSISIQVGPIDAGSDNGLTFTSPDWSSEPPGPVNLITAHSPKHPAGSFFYPDIQELAVLATFHLHKDKVYRLSETQSNNVQPLEEVDNTVKQREMSNDVSFILPSPRVDKIRRSRRCRMSAWSPWSPCSATCGQGQSTRNRKIARPARRGGRPCPSLEEARWCGLDNPCSQLDHQHFDW